MSATRDPNSDQQPPAPAAADAIGAHDRAIASLLDIRDAFTETAHRTAAELVGYRRQLGLDKYGEILHPANERNNTRDLLEELGDAVAYAHNSGNHRFIEICEWALLATIEHIEQT